MAGGTLGALSGGVDFAKSFSPPIARASLYGWNQLKPNQIPTSDEMFKVFNWDRLTYGKLKDFMQQLGFSDEWTERLYLASQHELSLVDYVVLYRRGKITKDELITHAQRSGFYVAEIEHLLSVTEYFPSPQDLIQFAVRDVYTPETVDAYKLLEDIPQKYVEEAKKTGLPKEQAENYWAAHWQLPSPTQVFEMLHRRVLKPDGKVFTEEDVSTYLKIADYSPQWRTMLQQISYHPLTRTDARRMYSLGVINRGKLKSTFLDEGYNEENAELLTQFTIVHDDPETTGMTRGNLMSSYVEGAITFEDLKKMLPEIGIFGVALTYWLNIAQYDKTQAEVKKIITRAYNAFLAGSSDLDVLRTQLLNKNLPASYVDSILTDMIEEKVSQRKVPSLETIIKWLESQTIDERTFQVKMRQLNYSDEDIILYLTTVRQKVDTSRKLYLKEDVYVEWFKAGIIDETYLRATLSEKGLGQRDIESMIINARRPEGESD